MILIHLRLVRDALTAMHPLRPLLSALLVAALATRASAQLADPNQTIIIRAARLIDGRGGTPLSPVMVRVEGERIAEVATTLAVPTGARLIDLGSATLLPGLIDLHTHLTNRAGVHWEDGLLKTTPGHDALWGARNARVTLLAGFTTCRDLGPTWPYVDVDLRNAIGRPPTIRRSRCGDATFSSRYT